MRNRPAIALAVMLVAALSSGVRGEPQRGSAKVPPDEFFIVSSIDSSKGQLLLKRPTEVTDVVRVDAGTRLLDEHGKAITLGQLRAGDTVFVRSSPGTGGAIAVEIRQGPMTVAELQKRYLQRR